MHHVIPAVDECNNCGKQVSLTVLDRNAAQNDEWVCNDCANTDSPHKDINERA